MLLICIEYGDDYDTSVIDTILVGVARCYIILVKLFDFIDGWLRNMGK